MQANPRSRDEGGGWSEAARLTARWLAEGERLDALMERTGPLDPVERARCQQLVYAAVRNAGRIEAGLREAAGRPPRFIVRAVLYLIGAELAEAGGAADAGLAARTVHHAVDRAKTLASEPEARLVNAVGRKLAQRLLATAAPPLGAEDAALAEHFSHPEWLVRRWRRRFGPAALRELLEWNQRPARIFARWRPPDAAPPPPWLAATAWPEYFEVGPGAWPEAARALAEGRMAIQDPGARLAVDLLEPRPGETWLDACAAPGGKSLLIADRAGEGRLVSADADRDRLVRLEENLALVRGVEAEAAVVDLLREPGAALAEAGLPAKYDAVLLDAPCSNSGVMRHRVDVKWRLREGDFRRHARQQGALLEAAWLLVAPGGRLVYSTCSFDPEENEEVVEAFRRRHNDAALDAAETWLPWVRGHDGAFAARLRKG